MVSQGNQFFDRRLWLEAVTEYEKAIKAGFDDPSRTDLGSAYRMVGNADKALAQYQAAQALDSAHEESLLNLPILYLHTLNKPAKAVKVLEDFQARFPGNRLRKRVSDLLIEAKRLETGLITAPK